MSDPDIPTTNDDEREVPQDDEELEAPPPTIDPDERVEQDADDLDPFDPGVED